MIPAAVVDLKSLGDMARSAAESIFSIFNGQWPAEKVVNGEVRARFPSQSGERGQG